MHVSNAQNKTNYIRLNEKALKPGDIILTTTSAAVSVAIRLATRSDISHAMVYVSGHSVIDATSEGVQSGNTQRLMLEKGCAVHVMRLRAGISPQQISDVVAFMRSKIGTEYSTVEAMKAGLSGSAQWSNKQFCSRLVAQAYQVAGIILVDDVNYCSPADLAKSPLLEAVENVTLPITADELEFWAKREDTPQLMRDATNVILDGARKIHPGIQSFDDLAAFLVKHPEHDAAITKLLVDSGYLQILHLERGKNPWQYDLSIMNTLPAEEMHEYCQGTLDNEDVGPNRYFVCHGQYKGLAWFYKLKYFELMHDLYVKLSAFHRRRLIVATDWMVLNGHMTAPVEIRLKPHAPTWFTSMNTWDPILTGITRAGVQTEGHANFCMECSGDPVKDYFLEELYHAGGGPHTLRLCDECVVTRRAKGYAVHALTFS